MKKRAVIRKAGWNYAFVPKDVFLSPDLTPADVRLYCYLLWRAGSNDNAWPKVETMAQDIHLSEQSIRLCLRHLIEQNWIRRFRNYGRSSDTYVFETQELCRNFDSRSANLLEDEPLTGKRMNRQQVSRLNESHLTRVTEGATPNGAPTPEDAYRLKIASALSRGEARHSGLTAAFDRALRRNLPWQTKTGRAVFQFLAEVGATPEQAEVFARWWWANDWRGKRGDSPTVNLIQELWPQAIGSQSAPARQPANVYV